VYRKHHYRVVSKEKGAAAYHTGLLCRILCLLALPLSFPFIENSTNAFGDECKCEVK